MQLRKSKDKTYIQKQGTSEETEEYEQENDIQRIASSESQQIISRSYTQKDFCLDLNNRKFVQVLSAIQKFAQRKIVKIKLQKCQLTNNRLRKIWKKINPKDLQQVYLSRNNLQHRYFKIIQIRSMENLQILRLGLNQTQPSGMRRLIKAKLNKLQKLELKGTHLRDKGIRYLIKGNWPELTHLDICQNFLTNNSIQLLYTHNYKKLNNLWMEQYYYIQNYAQNYYFWIFIMGLVLINNKDRVKISIPYTNSEIKKSVKTILQERDFL